MMILLLALTLKLRMAPAASSCSLLSGERSRSTSGGSAPSSTILTSFWSLTDTLRTTTAACSCSVVEECQLTCVCVFTSRLLLQCSLGKPVHILSRLFILNFSLLLTQTLHLQRLVGRTEQRHNVRQAAFEDDAVLVFGVGRQVAQRHCGGLLQRERERESQIKSV